MTVYAIRQVRFLKILGMVYDTLLALQNCISTVNPILMHFFKFFGGVIIKGNVLFLC